MKTLLLLYAAAIISCAAAAQGQNEFLDGLRKDEPGKGKVTVMQSADIDDLVNGNSTTAQKSAPTVTEQKHAAAERRQDAAEHSAAAPNPVPAETEEDAPAEQRQPDTRKKIMRNSYKTTGYRVQVFSGGNSRTDKQRAENAGRTIKASFPDEPVYVHFYSPSWKCRMGNYTTIEAARSVLAQVKQLGYTQACIVKGQISVQY